MKQRPLHKGIHSNYKKGEQRCATMLGIWVGLLSWATKTIHLHLDKRRRSKSVKSFILVLSFIIIYEHNMYCKHLISPHDRKKSVTNLRKIMIYANKTECWYISLDLLFLKTTKQIWTRFIAK